MSRVFNGLNQGLQFSGSLPLTAAPFTISLWFYVTSDAAASILAWIGDKDNATNHWRLSAQDSGDGNVMRLNAQDGSSATAETSTAYSVNTWHHVLAREVSSSSRNILLDDGGQGTDSTSITPAGADRIAVGYEANSSPSGYSKGRIAAVGLWDVSLGDDDVETLAAGVAPPLVRPGDLVAYYPLWGIESPEPDAWGGLYPLTLTGAPTQGVSPPLYLPT